MKTFTICLIVICCILSAVSAVMNYKDKKNKLWIINAITAGICAFCVLLMIR